MKRIFTLVALLLTAWSSQAQQRIFSAATGGNWNSTASWAGGVIPTAVDTADIIAGSTIVINNSSTTQVAQLDVSGTVSYTATAAALSVNGNVTVFATGDLQVCNGATGRSLIVKGNFTNNGTAEFSKAGAVLTMGQGTAATTVAGTLGVIRQLTVDNSYGVTLATATKISQTLRLQNGLLSNGAYLTINNLDIGNGTAASQCFIQRSQVSALNSGYTLGTSASLYLNYFNNTAATAQAITEGYEIPSSRSLFRLTMNNAAGLHITDDVTLRSSVTALELTSGIITVATGKTLICNQVNNTNTMGSATSFVNGGIAMAVNTAAITRVFPVGSGGQKRTVTLEGLASTGGTALVRFAIEAASGNTAGAGMRTIKGARRWAGSLYSGAGISYTTMSIEYGADDSLSSVTVPERGIARSATLTGIYDSQGMGTNTSSILYTATSTYNTLGYFAAGVRSLPMKITSTATGGNWNSGSSWTGGVIPVATDTAVILSGSTITVNSTTGTSVAALTISGTIGFTATASALTIAGNTTVQSGGVLNAYNGTTGKQVIVQGDFTNLGTIDFSKNGSSLSMAAAGRATLLSGTGTAGVFRQLVIDNADGVTLGFPVSVSNTLQLNNGVLHNDTLLTLNNTVVGAGPSSSQCIIQRSQGGELELPFTLPGAAALYVTYAENTALPAQSITEGYEIPATRSLFKITVNNPGGVVLQDNITLRSSVSALALVTGVVQLPVGKTLICNSVSNSNTTGTATSFVTGGGVAMAVGTSAVSRVFPVGSRTQNRKLTITGLSAISGTALVRVAITDTSAGTVGTGITKLSPVRRWESSVLSGAVNTATGINIDYGADDSMAMAAIPEYRIARSGTLNGTYASLGAGSNTTTTINTPTGTYTVAGWLALGMEIPPAVTYYFSTSGSDAAAGTSPASAWKTLAKFNTTTFHSGDTIRFNKGDTWYGALTVTTPGIVIEAYGTGSLPVISGNETIAGTWAPISGNIWSVTLSGSGKPSAIRQLSRNNIVLPLSRYPNKDVNNGYLNFESHVSNTQFTDNELSGAPDWTGAEVVVRAYKWRLVRTVVSSHSSNTITIPALADIELKDGFGYFFVNDLKAIDQEGEWAYNSATGVLYLYAATNPNTTPISFARYDTLVNITGSGYVTLKHVHLQHAGKLALLVRNADQCVIDSTEITDSGGDGAVFNNADHTSFTHNTVQRVNWSGLFSTNTSAHTLVENNLFQTIGHEAFGKSKSFIGIDCNSPESKIQYNTIRGVGYAGIISAGVNNLVKRNRIDSICTILEDMGGIYTNNNINNTTGTLIEENIVTNSVGEALGAPGKSLANGIYLDNRSQGVIVRKNTVAWVKGSGLFLHDTQKGNELYDNTSFASGQRGELVIASPFIAPDFIMERNILATADTTATHDVLGSETVNYNYAQIGSFDSNYLVNPFNTKVTTILSNAGTQRFTVSEWQAATPTATNNQVSPVNYATNIDTAGKFRLYFNSSTNTQTWPLPTGLYVDAANQEYCGTVTVAPYRSVLLLQKDTADCGSMARMATMPARKTAVDSSVLIYPNPSAGLFTIQTGAALKGQLQLQVYEMGGKVIYQQRPAAGKIRHQLNLTGYAKGLYLLQITVDGRLSKTYQLMVQ